MPRRGDERTVRVVDLDPRSVAWALAAFVGVVGLTGLVRSAPRTVSVVIVGSFLALALNPVVAAAQRRLGSRRSVAVGAVLAGFVLAVALLATLLGPPAVRQAQDLSDQLPEVVSQLDDLPVIGEQLREAEAGERIQRWIEELPDRLEGDTAPIERAGRAVFDGLLVAFLTVLVAITLLLDGDRLARGSLRLVPDRHRERAARIGDLAYSVVGRYVAGSVFVACIAGVCTLTAGLVLGVPLTPLLAVWVMVFDLVPQIGGAAGGIPFVLLGVTQGATVGIACAVFFVLYLQIENHVIQPLVVGRTVQLSPPATMTAALVGVSAAGVVGALVAVPLLGAVKVAYAELRPARAAAASGAG